MREEIRYYEVGRGYKIVEVQIDNNKYQIELCKNDTTIIGLSTGCIGQKSSNYWAEYNRKIISRLIFLADGIDMAYHNKMCYSTNILMDAPKPEYADKWHEEDTKVKMLHKWFKEIIDGLGDDKKKILSIEFNEYYNN